MPEVRTLDEFETAETLDAKGVYLHVVGEYSRYLWVLCPKCSCRMALRIGGDLEPRWQIVQPEPISLDEVIHHDATWCGWRGHLTDGEFIGS